MVKVVVQKTDSGLTRNGICSAVESLLEPLGGMGNFVKPGQRVLIKPNVCGTFPKESGKVTDPDVVYAVVKSALSAGAAEVWIAESSIVGYDTEEAFDVAGYGIFRDMERVSLIDLKKEGARAVASPKTEGMENLHIFERVFFADTIINVAKAKTINSTPISMGMKNLKGIVRDDCKRQCHYSDLNAAIVEINRNIKSNLIIIDGITGSSLYEPIEHGVLIAGEDIVAVDTVGALCVGADPETVKYLCLAAREGFGVIELDKIEIIGDRIEDVRKGYRIGQDDAGALAALYPGIAISAGNACSGCISVLESVLNTGKAEGWLAGREGKLRFVIGLDAEHPDDGLNTVCLGNCAVKKGGGQTVKGCPYLMRDVKALLESYE